MRKTIKYESVLIAFYRILHGWTLTLGGGAVRVKVPKWCYVILVYGPTLCRYCACVRLS